MKHIIVDFIKRWKWLLGAAMVFQIVFIAVVLLEEKTWFFIWGIAVIAPILVALDHQWGATKVYGFLAVERRVLAGSYWTQAVLLPTVLVAVTMLAACAVIGPFKPSALESLASLPHVTTISFAVSGTLCFILTFMPHGPQPGLWERLLAGVAGVSWGVVLGVAIAVLPTNESVHQWSTLEPWERILLGVGVILGIASLFTSRRLVEPGFTFRPGLSVPRERTPARRIGFPARAASLVEPWVATFFGSLAVLFLFMGGFFLFHVWIYGGNIHEAVRKLLAYPIVAIPCAIAFFLGFRLLGSLRLLRTLPIHGSRVTSIVLSLPLSIAIGCWLLVVGMAIFTGQVRTTAEVTRALLMLLGVCMLVTPLLVRYGYRMYIVIWILLFQAPVALEIARFPSWWPALTIGLGLGAAGALLTEKVITRSSAAYRSGNFTMPWDTRR